MNVDCTHPSAHRKSSTKPPVARRSAATLPRKPRKDFPLYPHRSGHWAKKVCGRTRYFGKVADDPRGIAALERWLAQKDDLLAGREPRASSDALTVADLVNRFLTHKGQLRDHGELNPRTFQGYFASCANIVKAFGRNRVVTDLQPDDFRKLRALLAKTRAVVALRNEMQRVRSVFKYGFDEGLILSPIRFGQSFAKPKLEAVRREREAHRRAHGDRMFEASELRAILAVAGQPLRTMILLAANCGFGQSDLAHLPRRAIDLERGWVEFPRPKTAVPRRAPLWPETIASIREWLAVCPGAKSPSDSGLLFLTCRGQRWIKLSENGTPADQLGAEFAKLLRRLELKRPRVSFYGLRHGFETIGGELADQVAVDAIMGHLPRGMASAYRERIGDDRLIRITEHVRSWLFGNPDMPMPDTRIGSKTQHESTVPRSHLSSTQPSDARPTLRIVG